jgi:hypothetical protein
VTGGFRFHGGRDPQRSVKLAEIVKPEMQRSGGSVILQFLADPTR